MTMSVSAAPGFANAIGGNFGGLNSISFNGNAITVGNGADTFYGTIHDINMTTSSSNGFATIMGGAFGGFNNFTFGNNILTTGNGNDTLYGTLHDINLSATNFGFIGTGDIITSFNAFSFGNNTITVGNGNDTVYADMHDLVLTKDGTSDISGNTITFGTSVINAGTGNDTLVGELYHIDLPNANGNVETIFNFLFNNTNTINPGQTTFNLHGPAGNGGGVDTLVFNVGFDMGSNIVNQFNAARDILEFTNASGPNLANVQAAVQSMANDGHGSTLVTFNPAAGDFVNANGGTIDFTNIHYSGQTQLTDLVNHIAAHVVVIV